LKAVLAQDLEAGDWRAEAVALVMVGRGGEDLGVLGDVAATREGRRKRAFQNLTMLPCGHADCDFYEDGPAPDRILVKWGMRVWGPRGGKRDV
jgi:hypothetical protein